MNPFHARMRLPVILAACVLVLVSCSPPLETPYSTSPAVPTAFEPAGTDTPTIVPSPSPLALTATTVSTATATHTPAPTIGVVASLPDPSGFQWVQVVDGLKRPTALVDSNDDNGLLLVLEQPGRIRGIQGGRLLTDPFMDISDRVDSSGNEQGLLGIALDPDYPNNHTFYLDYTDAQGNTTVSRFKAADDGLSADPASEQVLMKIVQPFPNHNGGQLAFGPDGYLYIGTGDGGSEGDPNNTAQDPANKLGKILRIDVRGQDTYTIPADNPYAQNASGAPEVWALGLRNPWRFSFDRLTGDLYIGDVGQDKYEEIDYLPAGTGAGTNFGWSVREGLHPYKDGSSSANFTDPIFEYDHSQGCAVTGGYVYRGGTLPEFYGVYLFSDYCTGNVWGLLKSGSGDWQSALLFPSQGNISSFGQDASGEIYMLDLNKGAVLKLSRKG